MAYKDKDKQKEANRVASQRRRDKAKGMTNEGMTLQSMTNKGIAQRIRARIAAVRPSNGTEQDDIRAASDRLQAALGCPAIEPVDTMTPKPIGTMTPEGLKSAVPANYGQPDCECRHCRATGGKHKLNHGKYKSVSELGRNETNRVSLPGDVDYTAQQSWPCEDMALQSEVR